MIAPFGHLVTFGLAGKRSPGRAYLLPSSKGSPRKWDEQAGWGLSGAWLVYGGDGLASFSIRIDMWRAEHDAAWDSFATVLERAPKGKRPQALGIVHPFLNRKPWSIDSVVVEDVSLPEWTPKGIVSVTISLKQFRAPIARIGRPNGVIPAAMKAAPQTAQTERQKEISKLTAEFKSLGAP